MNVLFQCEKCLNVIDLKHVYIVVVLQSIRLQYNYQGVLTKLQ